MAKTQGLNGFRPKLISIAVASCFVAGTALANPTAPTVVYGSAAFQQSGNLLKITNSPSAIINWQSFSIGAGEITRFIQQSQSSSVLNRVTGSAGAIDPSVILGALQSNGRVYLINPSGIVFGAGAQVDVAGLVASSLNLSNADFLANRLKFTESQGAGAIVNEGNINTRSGGNVYLVGPAVTNSGIITSPNGEVILAAGNSVALVDAGTPNLQVEITAPDNLAVNLGQIIVDSGRAGIYAGLIKQAGTIRADSAVAEGGRILLKGTKSVTLESTSILDASGNGGGTIEVLSKNGGTVNVAGRLDASAPNGGNGGFIETSADTVKIADGTFITTTAPHGKAGMWLVDPNDFNISSAAYGGDITGSALSLLLATTPTTFTSDQGAAYGSGAINVNDTISWNSSNGLTLIARGNVNVNSSIANAGTGAIKLYAGWDGANPVNPDVISCCSGMINLLAPITTFGTAVLVAGYGISQDVNGAITAARLLAKGGFNSVALDIADNNVGTLAGTAQSSFRFKNASSLIVGSVASGNSSIGTIDGVASTDSNEIAITVTSGNLTVNKNILAVGGNSNDASITLDAQSNLFVNGSLIKAQGVAGEGGGNATIALDAQAIKLTNSTVEAIADGGGCCGGMGIATVSMTATGGNIELIGSDVIVTAGNGGTSLPGAAFASLSLSAGAKVTIDSGSTINVAGGQGGNAFSSISAAVAAGGQAQVVVNAAGDIDMNGSVTVTGGQGGTASNPGSGGADARGGLATLSMSTGTGAITIGGNATVAGGIGGTATGTTASAAGGTGQVTLQGNGITVNSDVTAAGGAGGLANSAAGFGGDGFVSLRTYGPITVAGSLTATGGAGGSGGPANISLSIPFAVCEVQCPPPPTTGDVQISGVLTATGGNGTSGGGSASVFVGNYSITVNGGTLESVGGTGTVGGSATTSLSSSTTITGTNATIEAYAGSGAVATVSLSAVGNILLNSGTIDAEVGCLPPSCSGGASVNIFSSGGNIDLGATNISALGETAAGITIDAPVGHIHNAGGVLAANDVATNGQNSTITLSAANGIGAIGAPVKIADERPHFIVTNGSAGEVVLSQVINDINVSDGLTDINNNVFGGLLDITAEGGNILVPVGVNKPGNVLVMRSLTGGITVAPGTTLAAQIIDLIGSGNVIVGSAAGPSTVSGLFYATSSTGNVNVFNSGTLNLGLVNGSKAVIISSGAIVDGNDALEVTNIMSPSVNLSAPGGIGGDGNFIETSGVSSLFVTSTGGSGAVNIANQSSNTFLVLDFNGTQATVTNTGTMTVGDIFGATGNLALGANSGLTVDNITTTGNLTLGAGSGTLTIGDASGGKTVGSSGITTLIGGNVNIGTATQTSPVDVFGGSGMVINAGNLTVQGGNGGGTFVHADAGDMNITTTGNVMVNGGTGTGFAHIQGNPNVIMSVGGTVQLTAGAGSGAFAMVESISPTTIYINFTDPNLTSGGYFVNNVEGAIYDPATGSGFVAGAQPAILAQNLIVTYGGLPPVPPATGGGDTTGGQVTDNLNTISDINSGPETQGNSGTGGGTPDEKEKKGLPVCK